MAEIQIWRIMLSPKKWNQNKYEKCSTPGCLSCKKCVLHKAT